MARDSESGYVKEWVDAIGRWLGFADRPDDKVLTALISEENGCPGRSVEIFPGAESPARRLIHP